MAKSYLYLLLISLLISCTNDTLPFHGRKEIDPETNKEVNHTISPFSFINQDNKTITESYLKGKVTVVDFFFTSCPTICPDMTKNMKGVQEKWKGNKDLQFLSHTVDPETDTPKKLTRFAKFYDLDLSNWNMVTGEKSKLYEAGYYSYMVSTDEDVLSEHGFLHSSLFILVDKNLHIRGIYNGTEKEEIEKLNTDLKILLHE